MKKVQFLLITILGAALPTLYSQADQNWEKTSYTDNSVEEGGGILVHSFSILSPALPKKSQGPFDPTLGIISHQRVGIGTKFPGAKLHVKLDSNDIKSPYKSVLRLGSNLGETVFYGNDIVAENINGLPAPLYLNKASHKKVVVPVLEITGGSDLAEPFEIASTDSIQQGMVVSIDPAHPGRLGVTGKAYDHTVAGIISGANGLNPGLVMNQQDAVGVGRYPVALAGRVYCWANTTNGPIQPGDLLTSSGTPGHAMKVTDYNLAKGAIIGKAMSALEDSRGLVLVLITLQ